MEHQMFISKALFWKCNFVHLLLNNDWRPNNTTITRMLLQGLAEKTDMLYAKWTVSLNTKLCIILDKEHLLHSVSKSEKDIYET
jgi:hypothetical protein